jgi:ankyrin repeat protein
VAQSTVPAPSTQCQASEAAATLGLPSPSPSASTLPCDHSTTMACTPPAPTILPCSGFYGNYTLLDNISLITIDEDYTLDSSLPPPTDANPFDSDSADEIVTSIESQHEPGPDASPSDGEPNGWTTPLHRAAALGHTTIAHLLLQARASPNVLDSAGLTPLTHAVVAGHADVAGTLLEHGASIARAEALHCAVRHRRDGTLRVLLKHCAAEGGGASGAVDAYDAEGRTPLHLAVEQGFEAGVQMLLRAGADARMKARTSGSNDGAG